MKDTVSTYFKDRLEDACRANQWSGYSLRLERNSHRIESTDKSAHLLTFPIVLGPKHFGELTVFYPGEVGSDAVAEAIAQQMAAVLAVPNRELAVKLDEVVAALKLTNPKYDWCGIYRIVDGVLVLTSFRGFATPHPVIGVDSGVCGAAVRENETVNVPDVGSDSRYLSCDFRTKSEIVVPIRNEAGEAIAEIDIDSHTANAFGIADATRLELLASELSALMLELD